MTFDLMKIFHEMGLFARCVVFALMAMAVASAAVFLERLWSFRRTGALSRAFAATAGPMLQKGQAEELLKVAEAQKHSPLATLVADGLRTYVAAVRQPGDVSAIELVKRELARKSEELGAEVRRGMGVLASTGSVAPFVGLLGTVVGIIAAFQGIAKEGSGGIGSVSAGIAEALIVTALGLVVAIPAVLCFNVLSARADGIVMALDRSRGELVDHLESRRPMVGGGATPYRSESGSGASHGHGQPATGAAREASVAA